MDLQEFIKLSIQEDIGDGDHSSLSCFPVGFSGTAKLLVKEEGVIAGIKVAEEIFRNVDPELIMEIYKHDGEPVVKGDIAFKVTGSVRSILSSERLVLNIMQRMSGIATKTKSIVKLIEDTKSKVLDTRKTTPLMRFLEKEAVKIGGGYNHRMGLYDMIMLKDNHVDYAGGVEAAIDKANLYLTDNKKNLPIEIEVRNFDELDKVLNHGKIQRIMLDNFTPENLKKAILKIDGRYETEASGGITELNIRQYAETGVDFISIGALTHSVKSLDLSLKAEIKN